MKQCLAAGALVVIIIVLTPFWLPLTDAGVRATLNANVQRLIVFLVNGLEILTGIGLVWAAGRALDHVRRLLLIYPVDGLYPQRHPFLRALPADNQPLAQVAAAFVHGNVTRLPAAPLKQLAPVLEPEPLALSAPMLSASQVVDVDPETRPHHLAIGQTGSGKSNAVRLILSELARRYPCEFVICEPGGIDWNSQAAAYSEQGIAQAIGAVHAEFLRRQELLRAADVQHITQLGVRLPYLFLVCEEMDSMFDNLRHVDRAQANEARGQLRDIVRMGRKTGVCLITVATSATADIFDQHVRKNLANVYLFRNTQQVAYAFGVDVNLTTLPTGRAYSVMHGQMVDFPMVARPNVPACGIYHENSPLLAAAERRLELPLGTTEATTNPTTEADYPLEVPVGGESGASGTTSSPVVGDLAPDGEAFKRQVWEAYRTTKSITGAQRILFPDQAEGGSHWLEIREIINEMRQRPPYLRHVNGRL